MQPAEKTNNIINHLNTMKVGAKENTFHLRGYRIDAEALIRKNPSAAYDMLGAISCLERNHEEMHRFYKEAINCSGGDTTRIANYVISLGRLGFVEDSYRYISEALEKSSIPRIKYLFIHRAVESGRFCAASDLMGSLSSEEFAEFTMGGDPSEFIEQAAIFVRERGFSDDDIFPMFSALSESYHSCGLYGYDVRRYAINDDLRFILCEYVFPYDDVDFLELGFEVENMLTSLQFKPGVADLFEIDFAARDRAQKTPKVIPFPEEKMRLIESLVVGVEG